MTYFVARSLTEALDLIDGGAATILAGGTDLFAQTEKDLLCHRIVDLTRVEDLQGITRTENGWRIGASVTWTQLLSTSLPPVFDGLKTAGRAVGSLQIQNTATLVGNLCNASPAADGVPALLTLDAELELQSRGGSRRVPLMDFITGPGQTCLARGELISAILVPAQSEHLFGAFEKLGSRCYLVISIAMVAAVVGLDSAGRIDTLRLAVGSCGPVATRQPILEAALVGQRPDDVVIHPDDLPGLSPISDMRATAQYRRMAAAELTMRALRGGP